jgi:hypothetical protein
MVGETQAIQRVPPGPSGGATLQANTAYNAQSITLVAATSNGPNTVLASPAPAGCFVTFRNIGTVEARIRFGTASATLGVATASDYPIPAGASEEWWVTSETVFTVISTASGVLTWYRSSP